MSIKGTSQELYVGKKESNIITFCGNKKKIEYADLKRIEFLYASTIDCGYLKFIHNSNKIAKFEFGKKANDKIEKTVALIEENNPELIISERNINDLKFYQHWWFALLMMFCCCYPIGLIFMWYNKNFSRWIRILITAVFTILISVWIYRYYITMTEISKTMQSLQNSFNGFN